MDKRRRKELTELVRSVPGLTLHEMGISNSRHVKLRVSRSVDNEDAMFVTASTTCDSQRCNKNLEATLRRFASGKWTPKTQH